MRMVMYRCMSTGRDQGTSDDEMIPATPMIIRKMWVSAVILIYHNSLLIILYQ